MWSCVRTNHDCPRSILQRADCEPWYLAGFYMKVGLQSKNVYCKTTVGRAQGASMSRQPTIHVMLIIISSSNNNISCYYYLLYGSSWAGRPAVPTGCGRSWPCRSPPSHSCPATNLWGAWGLRLWRRHKTRYTIKVTFQKSLIKFTHQNHTW